MLVFSARVTILVHPPEPMAAKPSSRILSRPPPDSPSKKDKGCRLEHGSPYLYSVIRFRDSPPGLGRGRRIGNKLRLLQRLNAAKLRALLYQTLFRLFSFSLPNVLLF